MRDVLKLKNLNFKYDDQNIVFSNLNLNIEKESYVALVGENASGKSTLGQIISGLLIPNKGDIFLDGEKIKKENNYKLIKKTKILFQNPEDQFVASIVKDDIIFGLENYGINPNKMNDIVEESAKKLDIQSLLNKQVYELSGGEKQKAAIAAIIALKPEIIVFDEATSMLDYYEKKRILSLIKKLNQEYAITIIHITHDLNEVFLADKIILLKKGKIVFKGSKNDFFKLNLQDYCMETPNIIKLQKKLKLKQDFIFDEELFLKKLKEYKDEY